MTRQTHPERHAARAALYSALAGAFLYPDEETIADLRHPDARQGIRAAADRLDLREEATAFVDALESASRETLVDTYNALFGLPDEDGTYPVIPYEAHYTAGEEIGHQQRRIAAVVGLMEAFGVEPSETFAERQDHLAAELELMQVMAARRALAGEDGDEEAAATVERSEAVFLAEHLSDFVPAFAHELRQATDEPFYLAAADFAARLVTRDHGDHPEVDLGVDPARADTGVTHT